MWHAVLSAFLLMCIVVAGLPGGAHAATGLDRVKETKTLRCGYIPYEPFITVDPNTKKIGGFFVDYMTKVGAKAGYKVEFMSEINVDQIVLALNAGKVGAFCVPCTPDHNWANVLDFPALVGGMPYYVYVRKDTSFTPEDLARAKFVTVDGYALTQITRTDFPKASYISLPQTTSTAEQYDQLRYKKADAFLNEPISARNYNQNNPGVIKRFSENPVVIKPFFIVSSRGDKPFSEFLDQTFKIASPGNKSIMDGVMKDVEIDTSMFLTGDECKTYTADAKGELYCAPPPPSLKEAAHE